jgi:hypothetical protein
MSLFDAWESGCGALADNLTWSAADWAAIDDLAAQLAKEYPDGGDDYDGDSAIKSSHDYDTGTVYANLKNGATLDSAYVANCQTRTKRMIAQAGWALASALSGVEVPNLGVLDEAKAGQAGVADDGSRAKTTEIMAWSVFGVMVPIACFVVWKRHWGMH